MEKGDREWHDLLNALDAMEGAVHIAVERLTKLSGCDSISEQMLDLLRSAIDLEEILMRSIENLNKLSSSPSSNPGIPGHGTETAETAGSAETAQERNALGAAKTEAGSGWSIPAKSLRPLLKEIDKDIGEWIRQDKPIFSVNKKPVDLDGKSYAYAEYFKQKHIDPKFDARYSKYFRNERHIIAGSYVWADSNLLEFADELEKPVHDDKLFWIDVLINCQFEINNSGQVVGLTGEIYKDCEVLILLTPTIFTRAWCLLEAANYTRNGCRICVVGQCSFLQGEDYFAAMQAGVPSDIDLIKEEIACMFGDDCRSKFNRAIDNAVVKVYGESLLYNGRFQEAVPVFEKELEVKRDRGDDENSVADTYIQLGRASAALGRHAESLRYYDEALQRYVQCFGTGHVSVADTYVNMGNVYQTQGDYEKALFHYQNALEIYKKSLGDCHVSVAATYKNMGVVERMLGNLRKALDLYQKALDIEIKSLGGAHVSVAATYGNIANVQRQQGKLSEALESFQKVLEIFERALGPSHVDVAKTYNNIAIVLEAQGNYQDALETYQKSLDIKIKSLGLEHVSSAMTLGNIANIHSMLGQKDLAISRSKQAHSIFLQQLGPNHPSTKLEANNLSRHCQGV